MNPPSNISNTLLPYLPSHKLQDEENRKNVHVYVTNISNFVVVISLIDISTTTKHYSKYDDHSKTFFNNIQVKIYNCLKYNVQYLFFFCIDK